MDGLEPTEDEDEDEDAEPAAPIAETWVRHTRFGRGLVLSRESGKARVRFEDGSERVLLESVLSAD